MLRRRWHSAILLHAVLLLDATCQDQESECSTQGCQELHMHDGQTDLWFLQLYQNVSLTNHTNASGLAHQMTRLTKASSAARGHNESMAGQSSASPRLLQASRSTSVLQMHRVAATASIVFDALLVVALAGILACFAILFKGTWSASNQQSRNAPMLHATRYSVDSKKSTIASESLMATAVPPPVICPELILLNSEARFRIEMKDLMDENTNYFPILSPSGTTHFEAKIEEGRILYLYSPGHDTARIIIQAPRAFEIQMMNILDGQGRYFGKVEAMPDRTGLLLFHKNKPSVKIRILDISTYSMVAEPIVGGGKIATLSSSKTDQGISLRCQVKNGVDPVLCLAAFLALISLKPSLLELGLSGTSA
eukprot:TRINITY_DN79201_c0_g1_i1.p1 TRINITY_DN79201_c0_g1~~TRINITY_DN79201_c0_g1_i1.p1  ORF type:complete len:366 (-),score=57.89 TRINITY_DN79201_c0_g1_i1:150-1247(-)